jgi:hypothetical protein
MTSIRTCECCGAIIPHGNTHNLTNNQLRIYNYIAKHPGCTAEEIKSHIYRDDPNGGPLSANIINVQVTHMRHKLSGVRIVSRPGREAPYHLVKEPSV